MNHLNILDCPTTCKTCTDAATCQTCQPTAFQYDNTCYASCPNGTYTSGSSCIGDYSEEIDCLNCLVCAAACTTCTNQTACQSCQSSFFQYNTQCLSSCPSGTYTSGSSCVSIYHTVHPLMINLLDCPEACVTCSSPTSCQACQPGLFYYDDQCLAYCPDGTYTSGSNCISKHISSKNIGLISPFKIVRCLAKNVPAQKTVRNAKKDMILWICVQRPKRKKL